MYQEINRETLSVGVETECESGRTDEAWGEFVQHHLTESDWVEKERNSPDSQRQLQAFVTAAEPLVENIKKRVLPSCASV
jgi:hypothetical protein